MHTLLLSSIPYVPECCLSKDMRALPMAPCHCSPLSEPALNAGMADSPLTLQSSPAGVTRLSTAAPFWSSSLPASHCRHAGMSPVRYAPAAHASQPGKSEGLPTNPSGQVLGQLEAPCAASKQALHDMEPGVSWKVPAAHCTQDAGER